jgi:hypothetical protein
MSEEDCGEFGSTIIMDMVGDVEETVLIAHANCRSYLALDGRRCHDEKHRMICKTRSLPEERHDLQVRKLLLQYTRPGGHIPRVLKLCFVEILAYSCLKSAMSRFQNQFKATKI